MVSSGDWFKQDPTAKAIGEALRARTDAIPGVVGFVLELEERASAPLHRVTTYARGDDGSTRDAVYDAERATIDAFPTCAFDFRLRRDASVSDVLDALWTPSDDRRVAVFVRRELLRGDHGE